MKESAHIAVSYVRAHAAELGIPSDFTKTKISTYMFRKAQCRRTDRLRVSYAHLSCKHTHRTRGQCDIAMTGELTLTGRVLPIGGPVRRLQLPLPPE